MSGEAEHLRSHLTDGVWHDSCHYCLHRRRYGGTGVPKSAAALPPLPPLSGPEAQA